MNHNALSLTKLIEHFAALPGIGVKTAGRLAYHVLTLSDEQAKGFAESILDAHSSIKNCSECQGFTDSDICPICGDNSRDKTIICVVENAKDISTFERTREYKGMYHVLHGLISPMDGIGPSELFVKELLTRAANDVAKEVIMATNPTVEGEATAIYISKLLKPMGVKVSRLAYGIPVGADLEFADEVTLYKALENRNEI